MFSTNPTLRRIVMSLVLGMLIGIAINETTFYFLRETARPPKQIILTIPSGTADLIAKGEQPPSLPANMVFVVGDTLTVKNDDAVDHKLGPLWIPPNSSASLSLNQEESLAFECSFQPSSYFGLDVQQPLTIATRIGGIIFTGLPMGFLIAVYSFAMSSKKKENAPA